MKIKVNTINQYREIAISDNGVELLTGLLDIDERVDIAEQMIDSAYELLDSNDHSFHKAMLATITENL